MSSINQIYSLVKQELRSASRSRYIIISFVFMPFVMWGLQGGIQVFVGMSIMSSQEGETIFFVNYDEGNETLDLNLGDIFLEGLINDTQLNDTLLYGATINYTRYANFEYQDLLNYINNSETASEATPMIIIPEGFTNDYYSFNITSNPFPPEIELYTLPGGLLGSSLLEAAVATKANELFTIYTIEKLVYVHPTTIVFQGEEGAASGFGAGFIGFLAVIIAVMAPSAFVSTSFAGEREKKTLESILALPISRFNILLAKVIAGLALIAVFALMNIFGIIGFAWILSFASSDSNGYDAASLYAIEPSLTLLVLVVLVMFLSAAVSIGIGISVASLTKDVRSAESLYTLTMLLPSMAVGMTSMFGSLPEQSFGGAGIFLYLIPWAHAIAILSKGLYPQTFASSALTGSIPLDIIFHFSYMAVFILVCLFIASRVFEREGILN